MLPSPPLPTARSSRALVSLYYAALFGAFGLLLPYFALHLTAAGLVPATAARVLALVPLMNLVAPPLVGRIADRGPARGRLLALGTAGAAAALAGFRLVGGSIGAVCAVTAAFALLRAPLTSLADTVALEVVARHGGSYGRLRLWGSLGFLVAVLAGGALIERVGLGAALAATVALLAAGAIVACALPSSAAPGADPSLVARATARDRPEAQARVLSVARLVTADDPTRPPPGSLSAPRALALLLAAVALAQAGHTIYDYLFALHLRDLGLGTRFAGCAWAIGVGTEVALLAVSARIIGRVGAHRLLALATATACVRWLLLARVTSATALLALQPLHGVTFGLYYVAAVTLVRARAAPGDQAWAQGLLASAAALGSLVGLAASGSLLERGGAPLLFTSASVGAALATAFALLHGRSLRAAATAAALLPAP